MNENEVRRMVAKTTGETMRDFIDMPYDDKNEYNMTGIVVDNNDPDQQGKCRIRVYSVFDTVDDDQLPWALPDFHFMGSKVGSFIVPPVGAILKVYFDRGDIYLPHYYAKAIDTNNMPTQKDSDYPNNMVFFETDEGDYFVINRRTGSTKFNHRSGTTATIGVDGSVNFNVVGDQFISEGANIADISGNKTKLGGNLSVLYALPGFTTITDLSQIGVSTRTTVG